MKLGIMQPYFFPYIGYFQLLNAVDEFVIYDNIEFTKNGWINRNRILVNGSDKYITIPIKKDSDFLNICERNLADTWEIQRKSILNRIEAAYKKAPFFASVYSLIEEVISYKEANLFKFIFHSIDLIRKHLNITTSIIISSELNIDHDLKAEQKVIEICKEKKASVYINLIGGLELYSKQVFKENNINLIFLRSNEIHYQQFSNDFVPFLSIIDVMMFNSLEKIANYLNDSYALL